MKSRSARAVLALFAIGAALVGSATASSVVHTDVTDAATTAHLSRKSHTHFVLSAQPKVGLRAPRPASQRVATVATAVGLCLLAAASMVVSRRFDAAPALAARSVQGRAPPLSIAT